MNLSCSSACLAILTACLDRISFVWTACFDSISFVCAIFCESNHTHTEKWNEKKRSENSIQKLQKVRQRQKEENKTHLRSVFQRLPDLLIRVSICILHVIFALRHFCYRITQISFDFRKKERIETMNLQKGIEEMQTERRRPALACCRSYLALISNTKTNQKTNLSVIFFLNNIIAGFQIKRI